MRRIGLFLFSILILFQSGHLYADGPLSLGEALSIAEQNNPQVIEAGKRVKIAEARHRNSGKLENPEFDIDVAKIVYDLEDEAGYDSRNLEGEARISQPVQTWGKRGLNIAIAEDEVRQAEYEFRRVWMDVALQVKEQYARALLHQKEIELARDGLDRARRLLEQVHIKFNEGKARNHELSRSRLEVANTRDEFLRAENNFIISTGKLNILLGRAMREDLELEDYLSPRDLQQDFDELLSVAMSERADVLSQGREVSKADKLLSLAKRARLPDVVLGLFVEREEEIYSAGAGVSFELPLWNQSQQDIKEALLDKEIAESNLSALKKEVELDVFTAFQNVILAKKSLSNLREAIKEANELLRIITIEYQEGEASFLIYLEGLAAYKETRKSYLVSLTDYAGTLAVLEQKVGRYLHNKETR